MSTPEGDCFTLHPRLAGIGCWTLLSLTAGKARGILLVNRYMVSKVDIRVGFPKADQLMQLVEDRGYRSTGPRRAVVRTVAARDRHFTADELCRELPYVGRATVFRSLNLLVETGVLCRVLLEDGSLHYQLSHRGHHHHLICTECGLSQDLLGCEIDEMLTERTALNHFQMEGHRLEVYGRCHRCLSAVN